MGAGCAKQAKDRYPKIPSALGQHIWQVGTELAGPQLDEETESSYCDRICRQGNHLYVWEHRKMITFPTKWFWWDDSSDIELIKRSAVELVAAMNANDIEQVYLPQPGTGKGNKDWLNDVRPVIKPILDDRVIVVSF